MSEIKRMCEDCKVNPEVAAIIMAAAGFVTAFAGLVIGIWTIPGIAGFAIGLDLVVLAGAYYLFAVGVCKNV